MNYFKRFQLILLFILASCSNNDSDLNKTNGFNINGVFYETNYAEANSGNPYRLQFINPLDKDNWLQFGDFSLISGSRDEYPPLIEGTYSTKKGTNRYYSIEDHNPIVFNDVTKEDVSAYSIYWDKDENFKSGNVTIHSINHTTESPSNYITEITIDYEFKWADNIVVGYYSGPVNLGLN